LTSEDYRPVSLVARAGAHRRARGILLLAEFNPDRPVFQSAAGPAALPVTVYFPATGWSLASRVESPQEICDQLLAAQKLDLLEVRAA